MDLGYSSAYHLRCELSLDSGRTVILRSLHQSMTYAGWMEGVPSADWNDRIVAGSLKDAERQGVEGAKPWLIPPARRDYLRQRGDMAGCQSVRGLAPEWLPMVTCVGVLQDSKPVRDPSKALSVLTVVWYQDEFALPINAAVFELLRSVDWKRLAMDIEF